MNLLIRQTQIVDPASTLNTQVCDVLIQEGKIISIAKEIKKEQLPDGVKMVEGKGTILTPGWLDLRAYFREPGDEQKESIRSGQDAAAAGGFTGVVMMPSTHPPVQSRAAVEFASSKSAGHAVKVYQAGALTINRDGKDLCELHDMMQGGAIIFTDDKRAIADSGVMMRALQYAGNVSARVISYIDDNGVSGLSTANESKETTLLGFKGSPSIAELIALQRDLNLVRYTGMPVHFSGISTKEAVAEIRKAKAEHLPVTAEVYLHHLLLDDSSLNGFDSNYKVKPPLRSLDDIDALKKAVLDGTIDVIVSDHSPEDPESKVVEFDYARFGMIALESFYPVLMSAFKGALSVEKMVTLLAVNPRKILGLPALSVAENVEANFTMIHPEKEWVFSMDSLKSKSRNSPFLGMNFKGKVIGVYANNHWVQN